MKLRRKIFDKLIDWKNKSKGETALLIEGARRIGKSFIVEEFAKSEYKSYLLIDFSEISDVVRDIFDNDKDNLDKFFDKLSIYYNVDLFRRNSLIVFDEVQLYPKARQMIKHLVKDNRFDYIETGSLLSLKQNVENILLPSEEESVKMFPLDFEEFCWATNNEKLYHFIADSFKSLSPLGQAMHRKSMDLFRKYILIGGMPQAVIAYLKTNKFSDVDIVKRNILNLYRNDIAKFAKGYENKVLSIFDEIPTQLSKHEKKFNLSSLSKEARFRDYEDAFVWLSEAMITNLCFNSTDPNVGLRLNTDRLRLKAYFGDTGLLISHSFDEQRIENDELYKDILFGKLELNEGMIMENVVAQLLQSNNRKLYFYSRTSRDDSSNNMEIDFLISIENKIVPIEVKSSKRYTYSSLNKFTEKYKSRIGKKIILHIKDIQNKDNIIFLPLYMAGLL